MNEFVPRGYLTFEQALEHFGRLKHADEWEAEKASSKQEFQQLLFAGDLVAEVLTDDGILHSLRSSIWGSVEAARISETGRASISVGDFYFPATVHGPVLIKQSSIDALFDGDSDDSSQSSKGETAKTGTGDAGEPAVGETSRKQHRTGRPSYREQIISAYETLRDAEKVDFDDYKKCLYGPIREIISGEPNTVARGLGDEAIRGAISPLFDADKTKAKSTP